MVVIKQAFRMTIKLNKMKEKSLKRKEEKTLTNGKEMAKSARRYNEDEQK